MTRQIAAVHAGDIRRIQRPQGPGFVPIIEMPAVTFQSLQGGEGVPRAAHQAGAGKITEIHGGQVRQQRDSNIRRRRPGSDRRVGNLLEIVRRQPVLAGGHEGFKEMPGLPRRAPQKPPLRRGQIRRRGFNRAADPPSERRRGQPQRQDRRRQPELKRLGGGQEPPDRQRQGRFDPHGRVKAREPRLHALFRIPRGLPFQQSLVRHEQAQHRPPNRVQADARVVREKRQAHPDLAQLPPVGGRRHPQVHRPRLIRRLGQSVKQCGGQPGQEYASENQQRSQAAEFGEQQPTAQHQDQEGDRHQTPPQVVQNLPLGQSGQWIGDPPGVRAGHPGEQPLRDLPIAPDPAVPPVHIHIVARRMFLIEFHVANQRGPGMARLQQVVAQDGVFRKAPLHGPLEGIHIIDPLADERTFPENILIHIRNLPRVRINSGVPGKQPDKPGPPGARQAHAHARLHDAVAFGDNPARLVKHGSVQGMRHRADQPARGIPRQLRVGVEGDDITHARQPRQVPHDFGKAPLAPAPQERVKLRELPPLPLTTHP